MLNFSTIFNHPSTIIQQYSTLPYFLSRPAACFKLSSCDEPGDKDLGGILPSWVVDKFSLSTALFGFFLGL